MNTDERRLELDLITEKIIECAQRVSNVHRAQCLNYLKATELSVCLLINFGRPKLEVKRVVSNF